MKDKIEIETFKKIGAYQLSNIKDENPSCFNGIVSIKKYKITIEEIEEPKEIYERRIQELWDYCSNHHHVSPLQQEAKNIGYILKGWIGSKIKK